MDDSIIYEKHFPELMEDINTMMEESTNLPCAPSKDDPAAYIHNLFSKTISVLIPERVQSAKQFVKQAKEIGHERCMDTVIKEEDNRIVVTYTLTDSVNFSCLKNLIAMADELSCAAEGDEILFSLVYYTHMMYCNGRKVFPIG